MTTPQPIVLQPFDYTGPPVPLEPLPSSFATSFGDASSSSDSGLSSSDSSYSDSGSSSGGGGDFGGGGSSGEW